MMTELIDLIQQASRLGAELALQGVGKMSAEISRSEAIRLYGQRFTDLVNRGKLQPVRRGNGKNGPIYYDRNRINAALANELAQPFIKYN